MDLEEEVGESLSPPRRLINGSQLSFKDDLFNKLVERGYEEAVISKNLLRHKLDAHFSRLPPSYAFDVNVDKAEDVMLHERLLRLAREPEKRPAYNIRFLESLCTEIRSMPYCERPPFKTDNAENYSSNKRIKDSVFDLESCSILEDLNLNIPKEIHVDRKLCSPIAIHEIIFSTTDKPKLLSELSALLSDIGLNIREAHVFSTVDGYSLSVFVVDGWHAEDTEGLYKTMSNAITNSKSSWSASTRNRLPVRRSSFYTKSRSWEIQWKLLKIGEKIASGSCGDLHRGVYLGQDVAVKVIRAELLNEVQINEFTQEVAILREVEHNNVVRFTGACTQSPFFCIVTEYMPGGSLYDYLHKNHNTMNLPQVLSFAIDVSKGMEYLHEKHIIHRDLKTANLLMDVYNVVKVADFGVARFQNRGGVMTAETGTYRWMAPEVINHLPYDQKADVFSFGIVLWELVTAKVPYDTMTPLQAALGVRQGMRPTIPEDAHPKLRDLMQSCWEPSPTLRPHFSLITNHLQSLLSQILDQPNLPT